MTLDVLMPGMSGFEVLRELRADPRLADLPVVVVSVFSGREALSGEWVVTKPIDAEELADALGAAVMAGRVRVLAVGRADVRTNLRRRSTSSAIEHEWASARRWRPRGCARCAASRSRWSTPACPTSRPRSPASTCAAGACAARSSSSRPTATAPPASPAWTPSRSPIEEAGAAVLALLEPAAAADL